MYIEIIRDVIEEALERHKLNTGQTVDDLLRGVNDHIEANSRAHRTVAPVIQYDDPLCRLAYLYMHAAANATLFEWVIPRSRDLETVISDASREVLNICSIGGGPGTELLGLTKYLRNRRDLIPPRKISFTVIDSVTAWADTWTQLADATEDELRAWFSGELPTVAPMFLQYDALDTSICRTHAVQLSKCDVVVFNYFFSENKTRLDLADEAVTKLVETTRPDCVYVVIDRLEHGGQFTRNVVNIFETAFRSRIDHSTFTGTLDPDEQTSRMGDMLNDNLSRNPRVKFFTYVNRDPTVFWFVVKHN